MFLESDKIRLCLTAPQRRNYLWNLINGQWLSVYNMVSMVYQIHLLCFDNNETCVISLDQMTYFTLEIFTVAKFLKSK